MPAMMNCAATHANSAPAAQAVLAQNFQGSQGLVSLMGSEKSWQAMSSLRRAAEGGPKGKNGRVNQTVNALPFSGTMTLVAEPCMAATNPSAFFSMIGNDP